MRLGSRDHCAASPDTGIPQPPVPFDDPDQGIEQSVRVRNRDFGGGNRHANDDVHRGQPSRLTERLPDHPLRPIAIHRPRQHPFTDYEAQARHVNLVVPGREVQRSPARAYGRAAEYLVELSLAEHALRAAEVTP